MLLKGRDGYISSARTLIEHFCKVSNCSKEIFNDMKMRLLKPGERDRNMNGSKISGSTRSLSFSRNVEAESNEIIRQG